MRLSSSQKSMVPCSKVVRLSSSSSTSWPSLPTLGNVFGTGALVGPLVDSLHNQCLLQYDIAPITIPWIQLLPTPPPWIMMMMMNIPSVEGEIRTIDNHNFFVSEILFGHHHEYLFCSSWIVPPLLGLAYVILGVVMPRLLSAVDEPEKQSYHDHHHHQVDLNHMLSSQPLSSSSLPMVVVVDEEQINHNSTNTSSLSLSRTTRLQQKAIIAIVTTALLVLLSAILESSYQDIFYYDNHENINNNINNNIIITAVRQLGNHNAKSIELGILASAAFGQWVWLDTTRTSLLVGLLAFVMGPLCELPFCGHGLWHYLPAASDFYPWMMATSNHNHNNLASSSFANQVLSWILGYDNYSQLSLSSITGPCYFAVTMDAIAVARWLESAEQVEEQQQQDSN